MMTPPTIDIITVASVAVGIALADLDETIATVQAIVASCEHVAGAVVATGFLIGTVTGTAVVAHLHPPVGLHFSTAGESTPTGIAAGTAVAALGGTTVGALSTIGVALTDLAMAITTVQTTAASRERDMSPIIATGATAAVRPHTLAGFPFSTANASTPAGTATAVTPDVGAPASAAAGGPAWSSFDLSMGEYLY
jgi:hypothetical protein